MLERATAYEVRRQIDQWEQTGSLGRKSTYGWDEKTESTFHQRDKEDAHDYRYFPDPDLAPVEVDEQWLGELKSRVGELPAARRRRYVEALGLSPADAAALAADRRTGDLFDEAVRLGAAPKRASNLVTNTLAQVANERGRSVYDLGLPANRVAEVATMLDQNLLAAASAPMLFKHLADNAEAEPRAAAERLGLLQVSDTGAIDAAIDALIAQNPKSLQDYRAGKGAALGSLVGMVMKSGKGLNAKLVNERLRAKLGT